MSNFVKFCLIILIQFPTLLSTDKLIKQVTLSGKNFYSLSAKTNLPKVQQRSFRESKNNRFFRAYFIRITLWSCGEL